MQVQKLEGDNVKVTDTSLILCNHKENVTWVSGDIFSLWGVESTELQIQCQ